MECMESDDGVQTILGLLCYHTINDININPFFVHSLYFSMVARINFTCISCEFGSMVEDALFLSGIQGLRNTILYINDPCTHFDAYMVCCNLVVKMMSLPFILHLKQSIFNCGLLV